MASLVHSYARHINGHLVNVRAYQQSDGGGALPSTDATVMAGIHTRPPLTAKPGIFTRGLVPVAIFPMDRDLPNAPTQLWIRKNTPMQGLGGIGLSEVWNDSDLLIALAGNAAEEWTDAIQQGLNHLKIVLHNNPGRDLSEILQRPDVQEALRDAGSSGAKATTQVVNDVWYEEGAPEDSPYLQKILNNVKETGLTFAPRMTSALQSEQHESVEKILLKDRLRAATAQSTAETRAKMEAVMRTYATAGITHVQWKANYKDNTPCASCDALNGTTVALGAEFDHLAGNLKTPVWFNLTSPPRHPNCECRLVPIKEK